MNRLAATLKPPLGERSINNGECLDRNGKENVQSQKVRNLELYLDTLSFDNKNIKIDLVAWIKMVITFVLIQFSVTQSSIYS